MNKIKEYVISKSYTRYGGDHEITISIFIRKCVVWKSKTAYLCIIDDNIVNEALTTHPDYIDFLVANHCDLLNISETDFWNDRNDEGGRYKEFHYIFNKLIEKSLKR